MIEFARPDGGKTKGYLATAGVRYEIYRYDAALAFANERNAAYDVPAPTRRGIAWRHSWGRK
jgi:hypothetical protein